MHLIFRLLRCCATEATSSPSSAILHQEMLNKVFEKRSLQLLAYFKFFIMTHLPLHRTHTEGRYLQRELHQVDPLLHPIVVIKEP
jgi:hypothetical protein